MSTDTYFQTSYAGFTDYGPAAYAYSPDPNNGAAVVVGLLYKSNNLTLSQVPTADREADKRSITDWVDALTDLVAKANAWDDFQETLIEADDEPVYLDDDNSPYVIDRLTGAETDSDWADEDGDHYKHIDGEWHISYGGDGPWRPVPHPEFLTRYGPYRVVK